MLDKFKLLFDLFVKQDSHTNCHKSFEILNQTYFMEEEL